MEKNEYLSEYRTGEVAVPKSRRGLFTLILLLIVFFASIFSALSLSGLHLSLLMKEEQSSVLFIKDMQLQPPETPEGFADIRNLEIQGRFLTAVEQDYFNLPQGVYISTPSPAVPGLCVGDVLLAINGEPITDQEMLQALLDSHSHGAVLNLEVYRNGDVLSLSAFFVVPEETL